jgi:hypothetical protein
MTNNTLILGKAPGGGERKTLWRPSSPGNAGKNCFLTDQGLRVENKVVKNELFHTQVSDYAFCACHKEVVTP